MNAAVPHPAKYSDSVLAALVRYKPRYPILDPFGGTGKLRTVFPDAICLDIESEWATQAGMQADALHLPFRHWAFQSVITSPCYGNRMADHHEAHDPSVRHTYRHTLGHALDVRNAGGLQWGPVYRDFHEQAWREVARVLCPGGRFLLNVSDHVRKGQRVYVTDWHIATLLSLGFKLESMQHVDTPRQRHGANGALRIGYESLIEFRRVA